MIRLRGTLVNDKKFPRFVVNITERLKDWRSFWTERYIPWYQGEIQQNFETEGELTRNGWPDLTPAYAAWKARHFPGTKIMERTRRLRDSMSVGAVGPDTVLQVRPLEAVIGTRVPYAKWLVRRRPVLPFVNMQRLRQLHSAWVKEQQQKALSDA